MKNVSSLSLWLLLFALLMGGLPLGVSAGEGEARFVSLSEVAEGEALLVEVDAGVRRVRVEVLDAESGVWEVVAVAYVDGQGGQVKFALPEAVSREQVRVRTLTTPPPSGALQSARHGFANFVEASASPPQSDGAGLVPGRIGGDADGVAEFLGASLAVSPDTVEEADVWRLDGERLYFFNQLRGLQVFDLTDREAPVRTGTLPMARVGEQLYQLDAHHLLLLVSDNWSSDTEVHVVRISMEGVPSIIRTVQVRGMVRESRLIGNRLFLVTHFYNNLAEDSAVGPDGRTGRIDFGPRSLITEVDFSNLEVPNALASVVLDGFLQAATATPDHLIVALQRWVGPDAERDHVLVYALNTQGSPLDRIAHLQPNGRIQDKFKLHLNGDVLTTIAFRQRWSAGQNLSRTYLQTWRLDGVEANGLEAAPALATASDDDSGEAGTPPPPSDIPPPPDFTPPSPPPLILPPPPPSPLPVPIDPVGAELLATVELGFGEWLRASRFDGDRAYVVTFFQIDPFYVVDLSDPSNPLVLGELEIPGFSTYLHPMGDRVLALGVEENFVTAMLFDVSDPSNPTELDRVHVGPESGFTWSEGSFDERAITVLEEEGLLLFPYESWGSDSSGSAIQLISFDRDRLRREGIVAHSGTARRATALDAEHVVSVSTRDLFVLDIADRANPALVGELAISWRTDEVFPLSDHLVHLSGGASWWSRSAVELVVTDRTDPDTALARLELGEAGLLKAHLEGDTLYLLRGNAGYGWWGPRIGIGWIGVDLGFGRGFDQSEEIYLQAIDLSNPTAPRLLDTWTDATSGMASEFLGVHPLAGGSLAWILRENPGYWYGPIDDGSAELPVAAFRIIVTHLDAEGSLAVLADKGVKTPEGAAQAAVTTDGGIFMPTARYEYDSPARVYVPAYFARQIDFSDPAAPHVSRPVSLPGALEAAFPAGDGGFLMIAAEHRVLRDEGWINLTDLHGLYFDGAHAYLLETLGLEPGWAQRAYSESEILVALSGSSEEGTAFEWLRFDATNGFSSLNAWRSSEPIHQLRSDRGRFLAIAQNRSLHLIEREDGRVSTKVYPLSERLWVNLDRAVAEDARVFFPLGDAGVLELDLGMPSEQMWSIAPGAVAAERAEPVWAPLSSDTWAFTDPTETTLGRLSERAWIFRPAGYRRFDSEAWDLGDAWYYSFSMGFFYDLLHPWVYHAEHGWVVSMPDESGTFYWDPALDWLWTQSEVYPFVYSFERGQWMYYVPGGNVEKRWFLEMDSGAWFAVGEGG